MDKILFKITNLKHLKIELEVETTRGEKIEIIEFEKENFFMFESSELGVLRTLAKYQDSKEVVCKIGSSSEGWFCRITKKGKGQ